MPLLQIEIPEETLISLKQDPESFSRDLRLLAAVKLVELGRLSSGRAAQMAGMSRVEFLVCLCRYRVPFGPTTPEELAADIARA